MIIEPYEKEKLNAAMAIEGHVDPRLIAKRDRLRAAIGITESKQAHHRKTDMPGTYITGRSGVSASRIRRLDQQIERTVDSAVRVCRLRNELKFVEADIAVQREVPLRIAIREIVKTKIEQQFDGIEVGDLIDIGGNDLIMVTKLNRKSVVTGNGVGSCKWTATEIAHVVKKVTP